ncbi:MAG: class I SAM-dependent methyltransferase [Flavobacteriales bacterium]|jgi:trans-aconitate methyltransferase|nr:class I SAM-dependent methyltransferase [Flavobacteriales bacterium]
MKKREIIYLTPFENTFESNYLAVRAKENRVYADEVVAILPDVATDHSQYLEWKLRQKTRQRFVNYLKQKSYKNVLDIGCGNGWFTNIIAQNIDGKIIGLDINKEELEQGRRVFLDSRLTFAYGDLFYAEFEEKFDLIVLNAAVQYFPDLTLLFQRLKSLLSARGEIHILDSPFYSTLEESRAAQQRTATYYKQLGFPEMEKYYYHHQLDDLNGWERLYVPPKNMLQKIMNRKDSPFGWYTWKSGE